METKVENILFDFDGVILDSMPIRNKGFAIMFKDYPEDQANALMDYHKINAGLSRYHKIRYFFEQIRGEQVTDEQMTALTFNFTQLMRQELTNPALLIPDTIDFIQENHTKYNMHIVSGSDGEELRFLCDKLNIAGYFKTIEGSPTPKIQLVNSIMKNFGYDIHKTILIGDSINDKEAAEVNNISFFGYNNLDLKSVGGHYISNFKFAEF